MAGTEESISTHTAEYFDASVVSLWTWANQEDFGHLLDTRPMDKTFRPLTESLKQRQVVHIPLMELRARSFELPPRGVPFAIYVSTLRDVQQLNETFASTSDSPKNRKRKRQFIPWNITAVILDTSVNRQKAKELGLLCPDMDGTTLTDRRLGRLWKPDPLVELTLLPLLLQSNGCINTKTERRQLWDLGAGAGRDATYLAEELKARQLAWQVVAFDQRYRGDLSKDPSTLFMRRRGLTTSEAICVSADLHDVGNFISRLENHSSSLGCILIVRYWNEGLVKAIASSSAAVSGMLVAISHFGLPDLTSEWTFPHPKVRGILKMTVLTLSNSAAYYSH
jgi:hypothetical protein